MDYPYQYSTLVLRGNGTAESDGKIDVKPDGTKPVTVDAWVRPTEIYTRKTIIAQQDSFAMGIDQGRLFFYIAGYPAVYSSGQKNLRITPGEWVHLCAVFNMKTITLYINGSFDSYSAITGQGTAKSGSVIFGEGLSGMLRQVRIFNCALNGEQVKAYMMTEDMSDTAFKNSLSAYYDFSLIPAKERINDEQLLLSGGAEQRLTAMGAKFVGNSFLTIDQEPDINPAGKGNDSYTIQAWVFWQPDEFEDRQTIFANGDVNDMAGMSLYIERETGYVVGLRANGTEEDDVIVSANAVKAGQWVNIALTYSVDTMKLYIGGELSNTLSGLFPIPVELFDQQPRIGAEVIENSVNGQDWFTGFISRLDIWERELSSDEIVQYAAGSPDTDQDGLQASYLFYMNEASNLCNDRLLGERNGLEFEEASYRPPKNTDFMEKEPTTDVDLEPLQPEQLAELRERVTASLTEDQSGKAFYRVTSHVLGDKVYFVAHYREHSYTVCYGAADQLDPVTQWYIELLLIILGFVFELVCGAQMQRSSTKLWQVLTRAVHNQNVMAVLAARVFNLNTVITLFKALFYSGLLKDIIRAAFSGYRWYHIALMVAKFAAMLVGAATGVWEIYAGAITAELVVEVYLHWEKYPGKDQKKEMQSMELTAVRFRHGLPDDATIPLQLNNRSAVSVPEWTSDAANESHAAYRLNALGSKAVKIQATFRTGLEQGFTKEVRCINTSSDGILGNSNVVNVNIKNKKSDPSYVTFTFDNHKLAKSGIIHVQTELSWEEKNSQGVWQEIARTKHNIYVILQAPELPWSTSAKSWVGVLKYACSWAAGATTREQIAEKITTKVNGSLGLMYDTGKGASMYTYRTVFYLSMFLNHLEKGLYSSTVNCTDCATICATFANALGCHLSEKWMYNTITQSGFYCNKIQAIGYSAWAKPFNGAFNYHEVCMMEPLQVIDKNLSVVENNYKVYDACLHVDGSVDPGSETKPDKDRISYLPVGMQFSKFGDVDQVSNIQKQESYREHLAVNSRMGIGQCRYYDKRNEISYYIYKSVI